MKIEIDTMEGSQDHFIKQIWAMNYSLEITDKAKDCLMEATTWYAEKHD